MRKFLLFKQHFLDYGNAMIYAILILSSLTFILSIFILIQLGKAGYFTSIDELKATIEKARLENMQLKAEKFRLDSAKDDLERKIEELENKLGILESKAGVHQERARDKRTEEKSDVPTGIQILEETRKDTAIEGIKNASASLWKHFSFKKKQTPDQGE